MWCPTDLVAQYGRTPRAATSFIGPPSLDADWQDAGVGGVHRFLAALDGGRRGGAEQLAGDSPGHGGELLRKAHWAIDKVTHDMQTDFAFNTAIAAVMELTNEIYRQRGSRRRRFASPWPRRLADLPVRPHLGAVV